MIKLENVKSPFMCYCAKVIPLAFDESMSYYECLCNFYNYLKNEIMPAINENAEATKELQDLFIELQTYVDTYFDNLDVTSEVNAKLDEMVENGTMEELIAQYLQLQTTYTYNSVTEMKQAENLANGTFVRTSGYYTYNDGGGAYYKIRTITNDDVVDEMFIYALSDETLVAEYIVQNDELNILSLGCKGNGTFDNTEKLQAIIDKAETTGYEVIIPLGDYLITDTLYINDGIVIEGRGKKRLWKGATKYPVIIGYLTDKPFIHISDQATLYDWDSAKNHLVENVHFKDFCITGSRTSSFSITGIYANCYLSTFKNIQINGFINDFAIAGSYETLIENCQFTQSYQCVVSFNNNRTTIFNDCWANSGYHDAGSVVSDSDYTTLYTKNHMFNYCCLYSNLSYHFMKNFAVENCCYGIITRDSKLDIDEFNCESISEYGIHASLNLRPNDSYTRIDNAHFYNPSTSGYSSAKIYSTSYHSYLDLKTVDALPISNFAYGDIANNSVARVYSYISGERVIPLTLSNNITGATIINKSHYTERGFCIDYEFSGQTWSSSAVGNISGLPTSTEFTSSQYKFFANPTTTADKIFNIRLYGNGNIVSSAGTWIGSNGNDAIIKINYEYEIK